jgi:predicted type IV restriction endonuclease
VTRRREEADFQEQVVDLAESLGWKVWHDQDSRRNRAGLPDLELLRGATMLRLELKTEKGIVSDAQEAYINRLKLVRFVVADVVRPSHWDELVDVLRRAKR